MTNNKIPLLTATFTLAITLTLSCSGDDGGGNNSTPSKSSDSSTKESCITAELAIKANTLDDVAVACNASRSEVLSQLPSSIGTCSKTDLDFGKPIREVMEACGIDEIPTVSSSSNGSSSSSGGNSSSSNSVESGTVFDGDYFIDPRDNKRYKYKTIDGRIWMSENLNYSKGGTIGYCYKSGTTLGTAGENGSGCDSPNGRTYTYAAAMDGNASQDKARGICPMGWHIPNAAEWGAIGFVSSDFYVGAGNYDSKNGWSDRNSFGFYWLSNANAYVFMTGGIEVRQEQNIAIGNYFSVRCVMDEDVVAPSSSSLVTQSSSSITVTNGTFTDERDGNSYKWVKIGTQVWMAENLKYSENGTKGACYKGNYPNDNETANCAKYGRLYNWDTAMDICPSGWHLPSSEEWDTLVEFAGGNYGSCRFKGSRVFCNWGDGCYEMDSQYSDDGSTCGKYVVSCTHIYLNSSCQEDWTTHDNPHIGTSNIAGQKLKAKSSWNTPDYSYTAGSDNYGFSALPGGLNTLSSGGGFGSHRYFDYIGTRGYWWSSTLTSAGIFGAKGYYMDYNYGEISVGTFGTSTTGYELLSVRCVKD